MPDHVFLPEREPLVRKTARWLVGLSSARPLDLGTCLVVLPTAGAARRLRAELLTCASSRGVLPPLMTTPMGLLTLAAEVDGPTTVASRPDSLRAWADVIANSSAEKYPLLLGGFPDPAAVAFRVGESLTVVCAILAEAGLTPSSPELLRASPLDEDRWREMENLYRRQRKVLQAVGLREAQAVHIATAQAGTAPAKISRIIVAGVTDLSPLLVQYLTSVPLPVTLLTDAAGCDEDTKFDAWGRPDPEYWTRHILPPLDPLFLSDPTSESLAIAERLGPAALCVADPTLVSHFQRTLTIGNRMAFDPSGTPLAQFEPAALASLWMAFSRSENLIILRTLLEHPRFLKIFCQEANLSPADAFKALDRLTTADLVQTLSEATDVLRSGNAANQSDPRRRLVTTARQWHSRFDPNASLEALLDLLKAVFHDYEVSPDSSESAALSGVGGVLRSLLESPLDPASAGEEILAAELAGTPVYEPHSEGAIELHGWLEAPWLPHEALIISGCTEGALPAQVNSHPFLPDSLRVTLGLSGNAGRLARDIHQLHSLLAARPEGAVQLTLSRTSVDREPTRPSRLLFRCPDADLPARVEQLFGEPLSLQRTPARQPAWQFRVPEGRPRERLSVTAYADYLQCPMRFYFNRVLKMEAFDPEKSELDALEYGEILHLALEAFSVDPAVRDSTEEGVISNYVLEALDTELRNRFGSRQSLPVRVQRESLRARLRQFAILQARERAEGWRIVAAELEFPPDATINLAGMPLTGKIDRVEVHDRTGERRILDYKTFQSIEKNLPQDTHFATLQKSEPDFPEAEFVWGNKLRRWTQLQLPLYRALAQFRWPEDPSPARIGYFLLPEKTEDTSIHEFPEDDELLASALTCAEAIADRVRRGVYWPPRKPKYENYAELFLNRDPADALEPESIRFLQGQRP